MAICHAMCDGLWLAQSRRPWVLRGSSDAMPLPYSNIHPCMCLPSRVGAFSVHLCTLWLAICSPVEEFISPMYMQSRGRWKGRSY